MSSAGKLEKPAVQCPSNTTDAPKKRKNSVIEINDDEEDTVVISRPQKKREKTENTGKSSAILSGEANRATVPERPLHPLFTSKYSQKGGDTTRGVLAKQIPARQPTIKESHVHPDNDFTVYDAIIDIPFSRRARILGKSIPVGNLSILKNPASDSTSPKIPSIPTFPSRTSSELLANSLRPRRAVDVLSNSLVSTYVSAWMANLALGSPRWEDVRAAHAEKKSRKKGPYDDNFIVDDMFDFDLDFDAPTYPSELPPLPELPDHPTTIEGNCIILKGPPGSGKSASVYACAEELGWEVFEVFPGISKRGGKEVLNLVGAVGQNHIIGKGKKSMIEQQREKTHKQSVILLEEVDVLFEEDKGFWPAIQALTQYSKRPVILTCNDDSTIPVNTLVLQTTLQYKCPKYDTVRKYLENNGVRNIPTQLNALETPSPAIEEDKSWLLDAGGGLYGKEFDNGCDLRQTLMQLHLGVAEKDHQEAVPPNSLKEILKRAEALSFVDAQIAQPLWRNMQVIEPETPNELVGTEITQTTSKTQTTTLAEFGYENIIAAHILSGYNISAIDTTSLLKDTHAQQDILLDIRLDMLSATAPIMPSPILSVDYAPYIRQLVKRDDEEARMMEANSIASNRGTPYRTAISGKGKKENEEKTITTAKDFPTTMIKALALLTLAASTLATPLYTQELAPIHGEPHVEGSTDPRVHNSYIVVLKDGVEADSHHTFTRNTLKKRSGGGRFGHVYNLDNEGDSIFNGYSVHDVDEDVIDMIRARPEVAHIERDSIVTTQETYHGLDDVVDALDVDDTITQKNAPWGLARISHHDPLSLSTFNKYVYDPHGGEGVNVYVVDTGINTKHVEFEGRAFWGKTIPLNDVDEDGNGHGSHCAGTIASRKYGVAKKAHVYAVKVLGSNGSGTMSDVVSGVLWAAEDAKRKQKAAAEELRTTGKTSHKGSVANMSLGGGKSPSLDRAVNKAVESGLSFAVAAGNDDRDACDYSPASAEKAVTVGASTLWDERAYFSNVGECVDIFAPGLNILSTWNSGPHSINTISGTSMASPHTAGALAYLLSLHSHESHKSFAENFYNTALNTVFETIGGVLPGWIDLFKPSAPVPAPEPISPAFLKQSLLSLAGRGYLNDLEQGSPNLLLFNNATKA
ncbi:hypothetical protein E3Q17_01655 [Wallemia mellicola]|uniref:AAA+ ATPase domain-containing protein n=1 Tax=Wallemia mellicola TaxID=1708541 RepID=A0A4T0NWB9_9BASI|nr:hypothetical protein E3Q17_01655 [Wallemia mellicola]